MSDDDEPHFELWWAEGDGEENNPYSDWKITVEDSSKKSSKQRTTYSVHQHMLACKSKYFSSLFHGGFSEAREQCSHFDLPEEVAAHFPFFLDSLYKRGYFANCETLEHGVDPYIACLYLIDYFQVDHLREKCVSEIFKKLNHDYLSLYKKLKQLSFSFPGLFEYVEDWGSRQIHSDHDRRDNVVLIRTVDANDFIAIFRREGRSREVETRGDWLASFLQHHKSAIGVHPFLELTSKALLPKFSAKAALCFLLRIHSHMKITSEIDNETKGDMERLETRCIERLNAF
ncbi:MAG: hypothetical protein SGILL_009483, partial [Bacillariaceae sp.]